MSDQSELGKALRTIGACRLELGETTEAQQVLLAAKARFDDPVLSGNAGIKPARTQTLRLLARACFLLQQFEPALRHSNEALKSCDDETDVELRAAVMNDAGMLHSHLGSYEQGMEFLLASLRLLEKHGVEPAGGPLNNIGNVYLLQGDHERAHEYFERARKRFDESGTVRERLIALANVGRALEGLGEHTQALAIYERCLRLARESNESAYLAPTLTKYGVTLGKLGRIDEAFASFAETLAHLDASGGPFRDETVHAMANLYLEIAEPAKAEPLFREALATATSTGNHQTEANACLGLARSLEGLGRWREALECFRRYHDLDTELLRQLFSQQTQAQLLHNELERSNRERQLLRDSHNRLSAAYAELRELHREVEEKSEELRRLSLEDPLTKLFNRRELQYRLGDEVARLRRYGGIPFSLVMCDIDDFKGINDRHTHVVGDEVLIRFAELLRSNARESDMVARVGGEEFILLLPETDLVGAEAVAEKLRFAVESFDWGQVRPAIEVSMSAGVTTASPGDNAETLFQRVDENLYRAKRMGKNVVCSGPTMSRQSPPLSLADRELADG